MNILLVEDDEVDIMNVQRAFKKNNILNPLNIAHNGVEALDKLRGTNGEEKINPVPRIIMLDINMPKMNGWEFLEQYKYLDAKQKAKVVIMILTTSANPDDIKKAKEIKELTGYETKPLSEELLMEILNKHFQDYL